MFKYLTLILTAVNPFTSFLFAQAQYLSAKNIQDDLGVFIDALDHHPGKYLYRTTAEIDSLKESVIKQVTDSISYDDFYLHLLESLCFLNDGHTGLSLGSAYGQVKRSHTTLPFRYKIIDDNIYIIDTIGPLKHDLLFNKIISINGITSDSLLSVCYKYTTADNGNSHYKKRYNERLIGQNFDFFFGPFDSYEITFVSTSNDTVQQTVSGIKNYGEKLNMTTPNPLCCMFDKNHDLSILTVNTFDYRRIIDAGQDFHKFIDFFFKKTRKEGIKNIVIDVRENWGGSSGLAMGLFAYISPTDFKWVDYSMSYLDGNEDFAMHSQYPSGHYPFLQHHDTVRINDKINVSNGIDSRPIHSCTTIPAGPKQKMKNISKNKFNGNVYVLTSGITFSAGAVFASKCQTLKNVQIIGEPTGSSAGVFCAGGYLRVTLPKSGFIIELPMMERHIALPDTTDIHEPVKPDHLVIEDIMHYVQKSDPAINKVYELIK